MCLHSSRCRPRRPRRSGFWLRTPLVFASWVRQTPAALCLRPFCPPARLPRCRPAFVWKYSGRSAYNSFGSTVLSAEALRMRSASRRHSAAPETSWESLETLAALVQAVWRDSVLILRGQSHGVRTGREERLPDPCQPCRTAVIRQL